MIIWHKNSRKRAQAQFKPFCMLLGISRRTAFQHIQHYTENITQGQSNATHTRADNWTKEQHTCALAFGYFLQPHRPVACQSTR